MKKLILSVCLIGAAFVAKAQKSEVAEAEKKWNIYDQLLNQPENPERKFKTVGPQARPEQPANDGSQPPPARRTPGGGGGGRSRMGGGNAPGPDGPSRPATPATYVGRQLAALYEGFKHTDLAIANEKSKVMPEAWALRALFASSVAFVDTLDVSNSIKYQGIAEEAIAKAKTLNPGSKVNEYIKTAEIYTNDAVIRRAAVAYNRKDFPAAYDIFLQYSARNPQDTSMYVNIALVATELQKYPEAIQNYRKAISMGSPDAAVHYGDIYKLMLTKQKDTAGALAILNEAAVKYPNELYFITNATDLYLKQGNTVKADELLDRLIEKDPKNTLYIKVKADAVFNQAYAAQEEIRKLETAKKFKEADVVIKKRTDFLNKALPLYLKVEQLDPKDIDNIKMIKQIYFALGNEAKVAEYSKKQEG